MTSRKFRQIYEDHKGLVFSIARLYSNLPGERMDLFQEIWLQVYQGFVRFEGKSKLSTWIFSVAKNTAINFLKRNKKNAAATLPRSIPQITPEQQLLSREEVRGVLEKLSSEEQELVLLKYCYDQTYEELARRIEVPVSTIKSRLFEARKKMVR